MIIEAYRVELIPLTSENGGGYLAWVPDLPGCASDGATPEEAMRKVKTAITDWIAEAIRLGRPIPIPTRKMAHA